MHLFKKRKKKRVSFNVKVCIWQVAAWLVCLWRLILRCLSSNPEHIQSTSFVLKWEPAAVNQRVLLKCDEQSMQIIMRQVKESMTTCPEEVLTCTLLQCYSLLYLCINLKVRDQQSLFS